MANPLLASLGGMMSNMMSNPMIRNAVMNVIGANNPKIKEGMQIISNLQGHSSEDLQNFLAQKMMEKGGISSNDVLSIKQKLQSMGISQSEIQKFDSFLNTHQNLIKK